MFNKKFSINLTLTTLCSMMYFISINTFAQLGAIKGFVKDSISNGEIIGAVVVLEGTTSGTSSDIDGSYIIKNLKPGLYNLVAKFASYESKVIKDIQVEAGKETEINFSLAESSKLLGTVVISAVKNKANDIAVVKEIKEADQVVSGISSEQIAKSNNSDASQVVQKIPGVTVVDNRFIMIRGLADRYNTVWLNDASAPSSETDRKAFSFDMVPSGLLDRVLVFKTPSPELPGDYAGGLVKIYTKNSPSERKLDITLGSSVRQGTTFQNFTSDKSKTDFMGFDDGSRRTPTNIVSGDDVSSKQQAENAKKFNNNWNHSTRNAAPDMKFGITFSDLIKFKNDRKLTNVSSLNYSNSNTTFDIARTQHQLEAAHRDMQYTNNVRLGFLQNNSFYFNPNNKIEFLNFINQIGRNQFVSRRTGDADFKNHSEDSYIMGYQSRFIYSSQLGGDHKFNSEKTSFDWQVGYSFSNKKEPDLRQGGYALNKDASGNIVKTFLYGTGAGSIQQGGRLYQTLNENIKKASFNFKHVLLKTDKKQVEINTGYLGEFKSRNFDAVSYVFAPQPSIAATPEFQALLTQDIRTIFNSANFNNKNGFIAQEERKPSYIYTAANNLNAVYLSSNVTLNKFKILGGFRFEANTLKLNSKNDQGPVNVDYKTGFLLPSLNVSYNLNDKNLVRVAYGRTINRPEFREVSPFIFFDYEFRANTYGNQNLKIATIDNVDLRYEYYPTPNEMFSVALFTKNFINPIERVVANTGGELAYTFTNATSAQIRGIEVDIRKNMGFITSSLKNLSLLFNSSIIASSVKVAEGTSVWNSDKRTLQGQSPYVFNAGFYYETPKGTSMSLIYNVFGPRIVLAGGFAGGQEYPDVIEMPRHTIDLSLSQKITKTLTATFGISDILNQEVLMILDKNRDGKYERNNKDPKFMSYRRGVLYNAGIKLNF